MVRRLVTGFWVHARHELVCDVIDVNSYRFVIEES